MDRRQFLLSDSILTVVNANSSINYCVSEVIGVGGLCIVYKGYYVDNVGYKKTVLIKECYPARLNIVRDANGALVIDQEEQDRFDECKQRLLESYKVMNSLRDVRDITNSIVVNYDIYEANNTLYIISTYNEGQTLRNTQLSTLQDAVNVALSVAKTIDRIHDAGYLYLDVKPENIHVINETKELVILYDFDSLIPIKDEKSILNYRLSFTKGYSPIEQKINRIQDVGKWSDVYSIGALMFEMLFGRTPDALDCGANHDYGNWLWTREYDDRLYIELNAFFDKTLQNYYKDRYSSMRDVVNQLAVIYEYADLKTPFIRQSSIIAPELMVGRESELKLLDDWASGNSTVLNVFGMGGIGKSTIVRSFLVDARDFDMIVFLNYCNSIYETISDDEQFYVNTCSRSPEETCEEYSKRKLKRVSSIINNCHALVVIDNYDGEDIDRIHLLTDVGLRVVVISRTRLIGIGNDYVEVSELADVDSIKAIFEYRLKRAVKTNEYKQIQKIYDCVAGHTMTLDLIACQISRSYLSFNEAASLVEAYGFTGISEDKVRLNKDGINYYDELKEIVSRLYNADSLATDKKRVLKYVALWGNSGIDAKAIREGLALKSYDLINELRDEGWVLYQEEKFTLHPLIMEILWRISWDEHSYQDAIRLMSDIYARIENARAVGQMYCADFKLVQTAQGIIRAVASSERLCATIEYKTLLASTIINTDRSNEFYVVSQANKLLDDYSFKNNRIKMRLFDYLVYIYLQKNETKAAREVISKARKLARRQLTPYYWGLFNELLGNYYDNLLNGDYDYSDVQEKDLYNKLIRSSKSAIKYMRMSSDYDAPKLLVKYLLGQACLIIRSSDYTFAGKEIYRYIDEATNVLSAKASDYYEGWSLLALTSAWYHTCYDIDVDKVKDYHEQVRKLESKMNRQLLDKIDYMYLPMANMLYQLNDYIGAIEILDDAIAICDDNIDTEAYIRKKHDLLTYKLDVVKSMNDATLIEQINNQLMSNEEELG